MNLLHFRHAAAIVTALFLIPASFAQRTGGDKVDLDALAQIKTEAFEHSQVMENLFWMSEVYGPRVTNSRNHKLAAEWAMKQMQEWGLKNVHLEKWPFGYGWQIKHFYAAMESPVYAAFTGFPLAWTPGTNGPITVEPVWAPIHSKADFAKYHGKLKGKALLMFDPAPLTLHARADAQPSPTDEEVLARGDARGGGGGERGAAAGAAENRDPSRRGRPGEGEWEYTPTSLALANAKNGVLRNEVNAFLKEEGVAISITPGYNGDGGTIFSTYVQQHFAQRTTMVKTPEYDKLDVYFNDDGGSGRFRGVSAGGSPQMAAIFKSWIEPIKDQHIVAVSGGGQFRPTASPGGTDSSAFSWIGLNGIGFQQDGLEYGTRTHHSNADTYDRVQKADVMQSSMIEAWFVYNAATRAEMLPRIPTPAPDPDAKSHE